MSDGGDLSMMGNFKGVMLCNRPAQIPGSLQTVVGPTSSSGPTRPAFVSSVVADSALGLPPVRQARVIPLRRDAKNPREDVTWRHKKWLSEFGEKRSALEESMRDRIRQQQEKHKKFIDNCQAMRDTIRGIKSKEDVGQEEKTREIEEVLERGVKAQQHQVPTEYIDVSQQYPSGAPISSSSSQQYQYENFEDNNNSPPPAASQQQQQPLSSRSTTNGSSKKSKSSAAAPSKPGWARTSEEDDLLMDHEADSLINFAAGLDYNRYIDDLEVREAIKFVQDRVKGLEESKQTAEAEEEEKQKLILAGELEEIYVIDETQPLDAEGNPGLKKVIRRVKKNRVPVSVQMMEHQQHEEQSEEQNERDRLQQQEALSRTVLDSNRAIRNVHSSASVRAIMEKEAASAAKQVSATTLRSRTQLSSIGEGEPRPVITTIHEKEAGTGKTNPSNLPFLYRHPGI